jgi:hypothetical protein
MFTLDPGESYILNDGDSYLSANKIRLGAKSKTREWTQYLQGDQWMVDMDASGERRYPGDTPQIFTFKLPE